MKNCFKNLPYLQKQFELVKKEFFPRWDRKQRWKLELVHSKDTRLMLPGVFLLAWCDRESKTILFRARKISHSLFFDLRWGISYYGNECPFEQMVHCILIHEICHARTPDTGLGHGSTFQRHMDEAAWRAGELGYKKMKELLRAETLIAARILAPNEKKLNREHWEKYGREESRMRRYIRKANRELQESRR